jgi:hypothetical protein
VKGLTVELLRGKHLVARVHVAHVGTARHRAVLRATPKPGRYTLVVRRGTTVVVRRSVRVGR